MRVAGFAWVLAILWLPLLGLAKDYYEILEIGKKATQSEIKKAYRTLALKW
jgi:hypothetical protein